MLTKDDAEIIANKLRAEIDRTKKAHDLAKIYYNSRWIASFGIRRGSSRNQGHGHIPKCIHVTQKWCKELSACDHNYDEWIQLMQGQGLI